MQAIAFYLTYPFIYLIAILPFPALYKLSNILYYLLRLSGYRKEVVYKNLRNSFPDKSEQEIDAIAPSTLSVMPDGILQPLSPEQVRNLVAYLMSPGQVELPASQATAAAASPPATAAYEAPRRGFFRARPLVRFRAGRR